MYIFLKKLHRVLISATDMDATPLKLVFFNNFENKHNGKGK